MVTALGKELRRMRIDLGELLKDMAENLNITPSYLSSIENGKKKPTHEWLENLFKVYDLPLSKRQELERAYFETINEISLSLNDISDQTRELGLVFARRFNSLSTEQVDRISTILNNSKEEQKEEDE